MLGVVNRVGILLMVLVLGLYGVGVGQEGGSGGGVDDVLEGFDNSSGGSASPGGMDDALEGFESNGPEGGGVKATEESVEPGRFDLSGDLILGASYNFAHKAPAPGRADYRGLSRFQPKARLQLDGKLSDHWQFRVAGQGFYDFAYSFKGRDEFTSDVLDRYEWDLDIGEAYLQGRLTDDLDLKLGRQIVVWGKSDNIRITDVLNPLDNREPGVVDIEDLRLPVTMARLDYYFGDWSLTGLAIPEIRFNKDPVYGSDFFPSARPLPDEEEPEGWADNMEYGLALNGIFSGWDLSLYYAHIFNDQAHVEITGPPPTLFGFPIGPPPMVRRHARLNMVGAATNIAAGNWLFKAEAAYLDGFRYTNLPDQTKSRVDALIGLEYTGFSETTISLEVADRHILNFDPVLRNFPDRLEEDEFQTVLRFNRQFMHDTLEFTFLLSVFGAEFDDGAFHRYSLQYDVTDHWSATLGAIFYESGEKPLFEKIGQNDRVFAEVKFSF